MENTVETLISQLPAESFEVTCICPYESAFTARLRDLGCTVYVTTIRDDPPWSAIEFVTRGSLQVQPSQGVQVFSFTYG